MKIKNIILCMIFLVVGILNSNQICSEYYDLDIESNLTVKKDDLPEEFSDEALTTVNEFIQKTHDLDCEWVIYFDYNTGEILKCGKGGNDNVNITFKDDEFKNNHVASIHNHPKNIFSPPSGKNFRILERKFEDYELIVGFENFWILKAKGIHENLINQMNIASEVLFNSSLEKCSSRYDNIGIINKMCDIIYGNELLKYINNKNITDIQLTKKEYVSMEFNSIAQYNCRKWITDPEEIRLAREREQDPNILSGKDRIYAFYKMMGMEIDYDEIFAD